MQNERPYTIEEIAQFISFLEEDSARWMRSYEERLARLEQKYNANQPRVPAGSPGGGQWTSEGSGGSGGNDSPNLPADLLTPGRDAITPIYPELIVPAVALLPDLVGGEAVVGTFDGAFGLSSAEAEETASQIAGGHAFEKHVLGGEFPGISTEQEFSEHIQNILENPSDAKLLEGGRAAFWDDESGTIVVKNPKDPDGGTAFRPDLGKTYFNTRLF